MKKLYLLLIALLCAVCANADIKTAVFDFSGNPWGHTIGSGSGESAAAGNVDKLTADDGETIIEFIQGAAGTPARFWNTGGTNHVRCYGKSSVTITAAGVITNIKVTATTSTYLYVPSVFIETEGDTKSKEVELEGDNNIYTINIQGTAHTRWTRLEVTYDGDDDPEGTVPTFRITCARPTHNNFFAYEGQLCTGLQSSLASYESADNNEWLRFPAENTDNGYFFYNVGTQQFIGKSTDNIKLPMSTDPTTVYYIWNNNQNSDYDISIGTADGKTSGHILNASSWGAGKDFGARLAPATSCDYDPGNEFQFVETENSITQTEYDAIAQAIHDYYHQPIQLPFELSTAAKTVKYTIVNHHTRGDYYIKTEADGRIRYTQDQNEADRFAFYQGAEEGDGTAYIYDVTTGKYFTWTEDRDASINWDANPPVLNGVYVQAVDSKDDAKVWFFAAEATEGNYDVLPTSNSNNGWNICGGIEDFTVLNLYDKTDNSSSWSFGEAPMLVVNCAKANTLAQGEEARLGAFTVVYVNGSYMYIQDESGSALLYAAAYGLKAGDKVAAEPGLVVKSSPYKNLPELTPVTTFAEIQESVTEGEVGEFTEATEAPSFSNLNSIVKYTGVSVATDVTLAAKGTVNATWGEGTVTFYNQFAVEGTLEAGKSYTIVAANAVYNENLQAYILSVEEEVAGVSVTYTVKFGEQTLKTETITETVGEAPTFTLDAPAYVTVSGIPETIAEGTTAVTVETALNEQAPFEMGKEYIVFFRNGANYYFWNNDNGTANEIRLNGNNAELTSKDQLAEKYDNYRWTVGGDWMNGFTFQNNEGLNIVAPAALSAGANFLTTTDEAARFDMVKQSNNFYRFYLHGQDTYYIAHTSHNSHRVAMWNDATYGIVEGEGGASCVQFEEYVAPAPVVEVSTQTVTLTFVTSTGAKYMLNNNEGTLNTIAYTAEAPESARFEATLWSNDKYTYKQGELYLGYHRLDAEFKSNLNYFTVATLEGVTNNFITTDVPAGTVYLAVENRASDNTQAGVLILKEADQTFDATGAPFFNGVHTSAMLVEEYTEPTPEYVTSGKMALLNVKNQKYLGFNSNNIIANLDDQVEVSFAPFNETPGLYLLEVAGGKKDNSGVQKYLHIGSNARWSGSADTPTASNNTVRMYEIDDVKATEWHLTLATEGLVMGRNYMIVANCTKSGYEGDWGITGDVFKEGTADQRLNGYRFAETVEANNAAAWVATALPEPKPEGVTFEITDNEDGTFTVTPSDNEATYFVHVTSDDINRAFEYADDAACFTGNVGYISESSEVHQGECTFTPSEWIEYWFGGRLTYNEGEYRIMVATVEGEITGATDNYTATQEPTIYTYTYAKPKPEFPVEDKAYVIKNVEAGLFLNVIEHADKATILGAQPEKFFFTKKDGAWVIKNEEDRYVGGHATKDWNMSSSVEQLWNVVEVEGGYALQRADAPSKYIGFNNLTVDPDDATKTAAYRDKNYATAHGVFSIFEYTFPLQGEAYKVKNVDAGMYINLSNNAVKNTTLEKTAEKLFFTVAEEGGFYIQDEDGNYLGASEEGKSDYGWNTGNVKNLTWNVVEVEGGYAIQRVSNKAKHLGSDTVGEHGDLFTDKGISAHGVYLIMLFDTPETTPLEDLQAAIEAAKAIKAEDYATVPADLFEDLANEIEKAEALAAKGENAAVYEINEELAALEAAVKAITEYTEPTIDELTARLAAALTAANAAVAENYSEEVLMAGKPGYKAAELVVALEEAIATYTDFAGELTRDIVVEVEHAVRAYNEADICLPEVGKTYTIRNHTAGLRAEFGYYLSASNDILISSDGFTPGATEQWTVSEYDLLVEDDWGNPLFSEKRHVFTNKETGTMLGWNGSALGTCEGDPSNYTCWNYITTNPREHYADPSVKDMPYGTLGLQFYNGASYYRIATVWMRVDSLSFQGGDLHMHGLWGAYSSFYIFEEVDTNAVGVGTVMAPTAGSRIYNLQGQMQNSLRTGINIVGGQKVLK